jgi:hypothetical protein
MSERGQPSGKQRNIARNRHGEVGAAWASTRIIKKFNLPDRAAARRFLIHTSRYGW